VPSSAGDAELVALCRDGDESAWAELVERFSQYVYAIAKRGLRLSEADAEDVFQEVFARLFERLDDLRDDTAVRPYIAQVTRRVALDRHRAMAKVEPRENPPEPAPLNGDLLERLDEAMEVREALAMLPERCQEILDRFFVRDESYLMIAEALTFRPAPSRVGSLAAWEDFVERDGAEDCTGLTTAPVSAPMVHCRCPQLLRLARIDLDGSAGSSVLD